MLSNFPRGASTITEKRILLFLELPSKIDFKEFHNKLTLKQSQDFVSALKVVLLLILKSLFTYLRTNPRRDISIIIHRSCPSVGHVLRFYHILIKPLQKHLTGLLQLPVLDSRIFVSFTLSFFVFRSNLLPSNRI